MKTISMKIVLFIGLLIVGSIILSGTVSASVVNTSKINVTTQVNETGIGLSPNHSNTTISAPISTIPLNSTNYPTSYDLRSIDKVTPVENQGSAGDCWTFGALGSLESNLLPTENDDFSENNMKNILSNNSPDGFDLNEGGTYDMALAYLAGWKGPVNESEDPYNDTSVYSPTENLSPVKHVQDALILPSRLNSLDNNYIKWALMNYGAVATYMNMNDFFPYYNDNMYSYYYNGSESVDHAVDIVGWDDNYDKNNFYITPPGNGAFIIKNSWGSNWGDNGYFYVSYYDTELGIGTASGGSNSPNFVFTNAENTSNYNNNYQYDPYGWVSSAGYNSITGWFSNIFNSTGNDELDAASFYVYSPNSTYNLYMYLNPTMNNPNSGTLVANLTGTLMSGYWTINLASPVYIVTGELFSVVVKLTTPGTNYPIPIQYAESGYSSRAKSLPGQSYISSNGLKWTDAYNYNYTVCLKAFTIPHIILPTTVILNSLSGVKGELINLTAILTNSNTNQPLKGEIINFFLNGTYIGNGTTNLNGMASLIYTLTNDPGIYQISAMFNGDSNYNSSNITSNLAIITPPSITINSAGGLYNTTQTIYLNTTDPYNTPITYYTLDGSNPQSSNTRSVYNGTAIIITNTTTLRYSAVDPMGNWSPNYNQTYIIDTTAPTAKASLPSGLYNTPKVSLNATDNIDTNPLIFYSTDNGVTWNNQTKTVTLNLNNGKTILMFYAIDATYNKSIILINTYTIDTIPPNATASLPNGFYNTHKIITLSMNENGTIYYTLNGTTPTNTSTTYKGPITINSTTTMKFLAVDLAGNKSPIYTKTYTIDKTPPKISATTPTNSKTGVSRTNNIIIKFSENIKNSTNYNKIAIKNLTTGKIITITKTIAGNILNIKNSSKLSANTWYIVTIPASAIKDLAGNNLTATYTFKFKTGA